MGLLFVFVGAGPALQCRARLNYYNRQDQAMALQLAGPGHGAIIGMVTRSELLWRAMTRPGRHLFYLNLEISQFLSQQGAL
jgi:hypothetical protein